MTDKATCSGCGRALTATEREYYEVTCDDCEGKIFYQAGESTSADPRDGSLTTHEDEAIAALMRHGWSESAAREFLLHVARLDRPTTGECICPKCGLRHGGSNFDGGF